MHAASRTLAGLEAGVIGSFAVVLCFLAHSALRGEFWWSKFNVAAALFFGNSVFHSGPSLVTLVGFAEIVLFYSLAGVVAAWILPVHSGRWLRFATAILFAAALHWSLQLYGWRRLGPFAPSYFVPAATVPAHFLFALSLLRLPATLRAIGDFLSAPYSEQTLLR